MNFTQVLYLPDLFKPINASQKYLFDLIREPIRQGCNVDIGLKNLKDGKHPRLFGFDINEFENLVRHALPENSRSLWSATYHFIPKAAADYLFSFIPTNTLLLCDWMSPGLRLACHERNIAFLDIRISPLRFGQDLYIAIDTQHHDLRQRIARQAITDDELRLDASLLKANMCAHRARLSTRLRHMFDLEGKLVYLWQSHWALDLLKPSGHVHHFKDFADQLQNIAKNRELLFMMDFSHAPSTTLADQERQALSSLLKRPIQACPQSLYQILGADDDVEVVGINTPRLQEAPWFDKRSHLLAPAATPLTSADFPEKEGYLQVPFQEIAAPMFWHQLLTPEATLPRVPRLPSLGRHFGRELLDSWGDYEKVLHWERGLPWMGFERSGGRVLRSRIAALEKQLLDEKRPAPMLSTASHHDSDMKRRIQALKDSKKGKTAYLLGNGPSLHDLDIEEIMKEDTFWFNRGFKIEEKGFEFRPTYYFLWDAVGIHESPEKIIDINAEIKFLGPEVYSTVEKIYPQSCTNQNIISFTPSLPAPGFYMYENNENFSYDPSIFIYNGGTVIMAALQFAFYMGYSQVLLGGVDFDYSKPYFYENKQADTDPRADANAEIMRKSLPIAKMHFEKNNRILAKITDSPHLPLDYVSTPFNRKNKQK